MTGNVTQFFIVCPLVFLAGFVDAVAGGGGLISLPAYLIAGFPAHWAVATNKLSSAMGSAVAVRQFAKRGYIPWKQSVFYVLCALLGSGLGANLALMLDEGIFKTVMLVILPLTAVYIMRSKALEGEREPFPPGKTLGIGMAIAWGVGIYDGFYGPGAGTFLLLLLTSAAHMKLSTANGTAKIINLTTNLTALTVYLLHGRVFFPLGLTAGVCSIAGNYLGTRFFAKGGVRAVKPLMLVVLAVFFVRILLEGR